MENEATKAAVKVIEYVGAVRDFDNTKEIVTNIGANRGAATRYEIIFLVPKTDEESQERYGCPLATLIEAGVRQFTTRVDYKTVGFENDGTLKPNGHEAMQELADGYQIGRKSDPVKAEEKQALNAMKSTSKDLGMSPMELMAKVAALQEQGLL